MDFLNRYCSNRVTKELMAKFNYVKVNQLPNITKLVLSFEYKQPTIKKIIVSLLALELINGKTTRKGKIITTKKSNISFKIRAGNPVGCKITLRKKNMFRFLTKFLLLTIPQDKSFKEIKNIKRNVLSLTFSTLFLFPELEKNYHLFKDLNKLSVVLVTNCNSILEFKLITRLLKIRIS